MNRSIKHTLLSIAIDRLFDFQQISLWTMEATGYLAFIRYVIAPCCNAIQAKVLNSLSDGPVPGAFKVAAIGFSASAKPTVMELCQASEEYRKAAQKVLSLLLTHGAGEKFEQESMKVGKELFTYVMTNLGHKTIISTSEVTH